ncbi:MAG TPA: hypothetical protein VGI98_01350 [Candidatus Limnocylindrales bacterium]
MDDSLLELMEALVQSIEQRDASDPDAPAWEAQRRIDRLEEELARRVGSSAGPSALLHVVTPDEVLAGTA